MYFTASTTALCNMNMNTVALVTTANASTPTKDAALRAKSTTPVDEVAPMKRTRQNDSISTSTGVVGVPAVGDVLAQASSGDGLDEAYFCDGADVVCLSSDSDSDEEATACTDIPSAPVCVPGVLAEAALGECESGGGGGGGGGGTGSGSTSCTINPSTTTGSSSTNGGGGAGPGCVYCGRSGDMLEVTDTLAYCQLCNKEAPAFITTKQRVLANAAAVVASHAPSLKSIFLQLLMRDYANAPDQIDDDGDDAW